MWECITGDTVNTASRMESTSVPMAVQVSQAVVDDMGTPDAFLALGERTIKGKGKMATFLLKVCKQASLPDSKNNTAEQSTGAMHVQCDVSTCSVIPPCMLAPLEAAAQIYGAINHLV